MMQMAPGHDADDTSYIVSMLNKGWSACVRLANVHVVKRNWMELPNTRVGTLRRYKCKINTKVSGWKSLSKTDNLCLEL